MNAAVTVSGVRVDIPNVPLRTLNVRSGHWSERSSHAKQLRSRAAWHAKAVWPGRDPIEKAIIEVTLFVPTRHRRDPDGLGPTAKPVIDGLVDAGVLVDDSFHVVDEVRFRIRHNPDLDDAMLRVEIVEF